MAQPGRCFSTPESIRLVSGKAALVCPVWSRVQTPPEAPVQPPEVEGPLSSLSFRTDRVLANQPAPKLRLGAQSELVKTRDYKVLTFDCYGTLIDWETGIRAAFKRSLKDQGLTGSRESELFTAYLEEEKRIEAQSSYKRYREVLAAAMTGAAKKFDMAFPASASRALADTLPSWTPFPDTNIALERLARTHKLGILSNVDNDLLAGTLKHFTIKFDLIVTAEQMQSYKPAHKHFREARKIIGDSPWLHAAASLYHDIEPASKLGIETAWVNREDTPVDRRYPGMIAEVKNLAQLAELVGTY